MGTIKILHLSDLHLIGSPNGNSMKHAVWKFAKENFAEVKDGQKLLVLTGDFHNFGDTDYAPAKDFLSRLFGEMGIDSRQDVFMVPGNHDIDAASKGATFRNLVIQAVRAEPSALNVVGKKRDDYMTELLSHYKPYLDFVRNLGIYSDEECNDKIPVKVHVRTWRNRLHLLHLNTTLIADGTEKINQMADTLSATSEEIRERTEADGLPCIALGHNNLYDMHATQWKQGLRGAFAPVDAYLCGDRHQADRERRERWMSLGTDDESREIPNLCAPRGSCDEWDEYSQFGLMLHEWDTDASEVRWTLQLWEADNPGDLKPGKSSTYKVKKIPTPREPEAPEESDAARTAETTLRQQVKNWDMSGAAELLDEEAVKEAAAEFQYEDSDFDRLLSEYLDIMSEPEMETLFRGMSDRDTMRQLKRRNIVSIHYRELMKLVYERIQEGGLNLSEQGRIDLCRILLWSNDGERMTAWDEKVHEILADTAPEPDGSRSTSILYTEWGKWLSRNRRDGEAEAEAIFREAMKIEPKHIQSRHELGMLLERIGRKSNDVDKLREAKKLYQEILAIDPDSRGALIGLKRLRDVSP